jgi:hypothetical protein
MKRTTRFSLSFCGVFAFVAFAQGSWAQRPQAAASATFQQAEQTALRAERDANATVEAKIAAYAAATHAADRAGNIDKTLEWGRKILALDVNHRDAQMLVSNRMPERMPTDERAKEAYLELAMVVANKAHAQVEAHFKGTRPANITAEQWAEEKRLLEARVHATLGDIHLIRDEYDDSVFMYEYVVQLTPEDGQSQYQLGAGYSGQTKEADEFWKLTIQDEAQGRAANSDAAQMQTLGELRQGAEEDYVMKRDKAIESLARAVALGGAPAQRARPELERLYRAKNNNTLTGLDALISQKRTELGVR